MEELTEAGHLPRAVVPAEKVVAQFRHHLGVTDMDTLNARITHIRLLALMGDAPRAHELLPGFIADLSRAVGGTPEGRNVIDQAADLLKHREA
ncbi:hypothetical protein ACFU53_30250 [Streptomyces sp. NPDC057474]|uniref:hypothetical protein n=1 Tax=Streptomyces sp. NPDC057474 TaxID=3346144 RepID=UPI003695CA3D